MFAVVSVGVDDIPVGDLSHVVSLLDGGWRPSPPPILNLAEANLNGHEMPRFADAEFFAAGHRATVEFTIRDSSAAYRSLFDAQTSSSQFSATTVERLRVAGLGLMTSWSELRAGSRHPSATVSLHEWTVGEVRAGARLIARFTGGIPSGRGNLGINYEVTGGGSLGHFTFAAPRLRCTLLRDGSGDRHSGTLAIQSLAGEVPTREEISDAVLAMEFAMGTRLEIDYFMSEPVSGSPHFWMSWLGSERKAVSASPYCPVEDVPVAFACAYAKLAEPCAEGTTFRHYVLHVREFLGNRIPFDGLTVLVGLVNRLSSEIVGRLEPVPSGLSDLKSRCDVLVGTLETNGGAAEAKLQQVLASPALMGSWVREVLDRHEIHPPDNLLELIETPPSERVVPSEDYVGLYLGALNALAALILSECGFSNTVLGPALRGGVDRVWRKRQTRRSEFFEISIAERGVVPGWPDFRPGPLPDSAVVQHMLEECRKLEAAIGSFVATNVHQLPTGGREIYVLRAFLLDAPQTQAELLRYEFEHSERGHTFRSPNTPPFETKDEASAIAYLREFAGIEAVGLKLRNLTALGQDFRKAASLRAARPNEQ